MEKRIKVACEGTGFIAVADNGGEGIEHIECGQHHRAYQADTGSLIGNIMEAANASFTSARSRLSDRLSLLSLIVLAASRTFCSRL